MPLLTFGAFCRVTANAEHFASLIFPPFIIISHVAFAMLFNDCAMHYSSMEIVGIINLNVKNIALKE